MIGQKGLSQPVIRFVQFKVHAISIHVLQISISYFNIPNRILVGEGRFSQDTRLEYLVLAEEQYARRALLNKYEKGTNIHEPQEPVGNTENV